MRWLPKPLRAGAGAPNGGEREREAGGGGLTLTGGMAQAVPPRASLRRGRVLLDSPTETSARRAGERRDSTMGKSKICCPKTLTTSRRFEVDPDDRPDGDDDPNGTQKLIAGMHLEPDEEDDGAPAEPFFLHLESRYRRTQD